MADIKPFRAWRYNPEETGNISKNFSPLFDVVNDAQLQELYTYPHNSIHLSVPRSHQEAVDKLEEWKAQGVIQQDPLPGIYVYYQYFTLYGESRKYCRKGFIAMVRMKEGDDDDIILHENTITASVQDRIELLSKTHLNVAPTHGLYEDADFALEKIMDSYMESPLYEYIDYQGVINKLAIIQDPRDIAHFTSKLAQIPVYLADGHHRLASSQAFRDLHKSQGLHPDSVLNYHLIYLTNLHSDDLRILPTHRVWKPIGEINTREVVGRLLDWFDFVNVSNSRRPMYEMLKGKKASFGLVSKEQRWIISLRADIEPEKTINLDLPDVLKQLDYTILHYYIFDQAIGISYNEQHAASEIVYEKDYARALTWVSNGEAALSFIANEVSMREMLNICKTGAKMPQKSTYFYPKVVCGLVFGSINETENSSTFDTGFKLSKETTTSP